MKEKIIKALVEGESVAIKYNLKTWHEVIFLGHVNPAKEIAAEILSELNEAEKTAIYKRRLKSLL